MAEVETAAILPAGASQTALPSPARRSWIRWIIVAVFVLAIVGFYALGLHHYISWGYVQAHRDLLHAQVDQHLLLALVIFLLVYAAITALSLPAAVVLTLLAGTLFGRWLGTGVVSLGSTTGATLAFLSSRYLLRDFIQRRFGPRLKSLNEGVERDGAFYLLSLRLVPLFPFFLVNLGMGLTPIRVRTFIWVSLLGMLPGTFLYVNAGTALGSIDSPKDVLSPTVLISLAVLGIAPLLLRYLLRWKIRPRTLILILVALVCCVLIGVAVRTKLRYAQAPVMEVAVTEYSNADYPDDPADRGTHFAQYNGRKLTLVQKDATHFDFVLEPTEAHVARVVFRDVDVSLMTPSLPEWARSDDGLRRIALTDRQWNRQQVAFGRDPAHVEVADGDGFEQQHLLSAELAKNCLNAGLWEVLLFADENGQKKLYYQGWFTFPLGQYARIFEENTGLPYWKHWYYLEHWVNPDGTPLRLEGLRSVTAEREVTTHFDPDERILSFGEQARKRRTVIAENVRTWGDYYEGRTIRFATFIPPGRYSVAHPWKNEYWRMDRFEKAIVRTVVSPGSTRPLRELELGFGSSHIPGKVRFLVSGFDPERLPRLSAEDYAKTMAATAKGDEVFAYMPMGIGTPPFFQEYAALQKNPPARSPYFSVTLDEKDRWLNHHDLAIDGPVLHRDSADPNLLHVYLLSYERHTLIGHWRVEIGE